MNRVTLKKLSDLTNNFDNKRIPLSSKQREKIKKIYPYYGAQNIIDYVDGYIFDGEYILVAEDGENLKSQNAKVCNLVNVKFWVNNHAHIIQGKEWNNTKYLYYYLNLIDFRPFVTWSAQPKLTQDNLSSIILEVHDIHEQNKIATVLSSIDKKAELNNKINTELEVMAKTLYDYWFVQFDFPDKNWKPYKSSGWEMVWNKELKTEIPKGWEVLKIGDLTEVKRGVNITKKTVAVWSVPVIAAGLEPSCYHNKSNTLSPVITVSWSGANAGYIHLHTQEIWASDCSYIDQSMCNEIYTMYLFLKKRQGDVYNMQKGSAQPHVYPKDIMDIKIEVNKNLGIFSKFEEIVSPIFMTIGSNRSENQNLSELRDWLLPMLMNGQVSVN